MEETKNEEDMKNCPFFQKIGTCRHGERCTRVHIKPLISKTLMIKHLYDDPQMLQNKGTSLLQNKTQNLNIEEFSTYQKQFENLYSDLFTNLSQYGEIFELNILENLGEHMVGNVYIKYSSEKEAEVAYESIQNQNYGNLNPNLREGQNRVIDIEFSPVIDFQEAKCRKFEESTCERGSYCNFMHIKSVDKSLKKQLIKEMYENYPTYKEQKNKRQTLAHKLKLYEIRREKALKY